MPYKSELEQNVSKYGIYLIAIFLWIYYRGKLGLVSFDKATFWFWFFLAIWWVGSGVYYSEKYKTHHVVWNNGSASSIDRPLFIGDWVIVAFGGVRGTILPEMHDGDGVIVIPKECYGEMGNQKFITARVEAADLGDIPQELWNALETNPHYNLNNIYFGVSTETWEQENVEIKTLVEKLKGSNSRQREMYDMLRNKFGVVEEAAGFGARLREKVERKGFLSRWFSKEESQEGESGA